MKALHEILQTLEPAAALTELTPIVKQILTHLEEEDRVKFVTDMIDESHGDKITSMVHL